MNKINYILNIGSGKEMSLLEQYIVDNEPYFLINLDKSYFNGFTPEDIETSYFDFEENQLIMDCNFCPRSEYDCNYDIFEFMERTRIKFDIIFIHRFFEHINREKLLYFIYLLSTVTTEGSIIDIISPDYKILAEMIINEKIDDPNFDKKDIIISTELFNEINDPHQNITTPDRIKRLFEYEGRFAVELECPRYGYDGRDIYFRSTIKRM